MQEQTINQRASGRDRVLPEMRVLSAFITPFLMLAFAILYFVPDETEQRFAWGIGPQMTAMMLGATYLTGVFYFSTALFARRWQQVRFGLLPVTTFAGLLGIATLLHWDAFTHDHISFWLWAGLYLTTPFIVFGVWVRNSRAAPIGPPAERDLLLPRIVRAAVGIVGVSGLVTTLLLFVLPNVMIDVWPWTLSVLTARVMAAIFAVFSAFAVAAFLDPRWESLRLLTRSQLVSPVFFLIAVAVSWADFDKSNPLTWVFAFNVAFVFTLGLPAMYVFMEARWKRASRAPQGAD